MERECFRDRVPVWEDGKVLSRMRNNVNVLSALVVHVKMVKMLNCMLHIFYHNFKKPI